MVELNQLFLKVADHLLEARVFVLELILAEALVLPFMELLVPARFVLISRRVVVKLCYLRVLPSWLHTDSEDAILILRCRIVSVLYTFLTIEILDIACILANRVRRLRNIRHAHQGAHLRSWNLVAALGSTIWQRIRNMAASILHSTRAVSPIADGVVLLLIDSEHVGAALHALLRVH